MRKRYIIALSLVAVLSLSTYVIITNIIRSQASNGHIINVSGRQRMLSQRTTLLVQQLVFTQDERERQKVRAALLEATNLMERSHLGLIAGSEELRLPGNPSSALQDIYFAAPVNLDQQVRNHLKNLRKVLEASNGDLKPDNEALRDILEAAPNRLLDSLNDAVNQYELESSQQIARLKTVERFILLITLITLVLEGIFIFRPMEKEIEQRSRELVHNALHDSLTGLPNRALFMDRLNQAILRRERYPDQSFAALFLDFNRFKVINDSLGHTVGDALLKRFGERLEQCVRESDTVARLGGDEFTILLESVADLAQAKVVAGRINDALLQPFDIEGHSLHVSASIGIVAAEDAHVKAEDVVRDADIAMYRAKASGKIGYEVFTREMRERALNLMSLETDLHSAIERGELVVYYQPIVSTLKGCAEGFEALVRWEHRRHGLVSPADFIPIAEDTGLIVELDRFVIRTACEQLVAWHSEGHTHLSMSLNLSSQQFEQADLVTFVEMLIRDTGVDPKRLNFEITESALLVSTSEITETFERLKALGIRLHVDDFGTGYSSLAYLQTFPADTIKVDRSFVDKLTESGESAKLVKTIIALAHSLRMTVVAEGVETEAQLEQLKALACEYSQGYYFSKPLTHEDATVFLATPLEVT